jgi:hypothetical protein
VLKLQHLNLHFLDTVVVVESAVLKNQTSTEESPHKTTNTTSTTPLKEPNLEHLASAQETTPAQPQLPASSTNSSSPETVTCNNPIPAHSISGFKDGITKSTSVQLPMQTIFLTSCPVTPLVSQGQNPQMITRIALGPTRILPKPVDGILRKIAILPIRKPLPPKEKKRRNRKKKVPVVTAEAEVQTKSGSENSKDDLVTEPSLDSGIPLLITLEDENPSGISTEKDLPEKIIHETTNDKEGKSDASGASEHELHLQCSSSKPTTDDEAKTRNNQLVTPMEVDMSEVGEEVEVTSTAVPEHKTADELDMDTTNSISEHSVQLAFKENPLKSPEHISEGSPNLLDISSSTASIHGHQKVHDIADAGRTATGNDESTSKENLGESSVSIHKPSELRAIDTTEVDNTTVQPSHREIINTPNQDAISSLSGTVTGDKISECIARSIDLIDAPDGELMELADNWGDSTVNSPKSPISPTQMFLSMFPLLPRESIVAVSEGTQQGGGSGKSSFQYRSSFYIDAMLPDEPSASEPNNGRIEPVPFSDTETTAIVSRNHAVLSNIGPSCTIPSTVGSVSSASVSSSKTIVSSSPTIKVASGHSAQSTKSILTVSSASGVAMSSRTDAAPSSSNNPKQDTQKLSSVAEIAKSSSCTSVNSRSKANEIEQREINKTQLPLSTSTLLPDFSLFPEPLEFSNFHPMPLSQMSLSEDLFREVTRIRNVPECQHAITSNVPSNYQQIDFANQHSQSQQRSAQLSSESIESQLRLGVISGTNQGISNIPSEKLPSVSSQSGFSNPSNFYQPQPPSVSVCSSVNNRPEHSHYQTQQPNSQYQRTTFSYDTEFLSRQSHFPQYNNNQIPIAQRKPTQDQSEGQQKHQLFRPQVGDFNQQSTSLGQNNRSSAPQVTNSTLSATKTSSSNFIAHQAKPITSTSAAAHQSTNQNNATTSNNRFAQQPTTTSSTIQRKVNVPQSQSHHSNPNYQSYSTSLSASNNSSLQLHTASHKHPQPAHPSENSSQGEKQQSNVSRNDNPPQSKTSDARSHVKTVPKSQSTKSSNSVSSGRKSNGGSCQNRKSNQSNQASQNSTNFSSIASHNTVNQVGHVDLTNAPSSICSFPDFTISGNFHQPHDTFPAPLHYANTSAYSSNLVQHSSEQQQSHNPTQQHPNQQQRKAPGSRNTPFYLSDVNPPCDSYFNIVPPQNTTNLSSPHNIASHTQLPTYGNSISSNSKSHYQSNPCINNSNNQSSTFTAPQTQSHNYFGNFPAQNTPVYQGAYLHQNSTSSVSRPHHNDPSSANNNYNINAAPTFSNANNPPANPNHQQTQQQAKSKPSTSTSVTSQQKPNQSNKYGVDADAPSSSSSRPVNWMTTDTSNRHSKTNQSTGANPFSVSKLVGNAPVHNSANNSSNTNSSSVSKQPSNSSTNINRFNNNASVHSASNPNPNNSYCAESLIRKNPETSNNNNSWNSHPMNQHHNLNHHSSISNANNCPPAAYDVTSNEHFNFSGYHTTNFPQHSSHQYYPPNPPGPPAPNNNMSSIGNPHQFGAPFATQGSRQHQQQPLLNASSNQYHQFGPGNNSSNQPHQHHHGSTSSVSNFNLSTIFPEINDKRGGSGSSSNTVNNNNGGNSRGNIGTSGNNAGNASDNTNNCSYYPTSHSRK